MLYPIDIILRFYLSLTFRNACGCVLIELLRIAACTYLSFSKFEFYLVYGMFGCLISVAMTTLLR